MRRALAWVAGLAMVALAAGVGHLTLSDGQQQAPFVVHAAIGERAEGRAFAVTLRQVRVADRVTADGGWSAEGNWLVVDLDAEALRTETASILSLAELDLGERTISASERPDSLESTPLDVGLAHSGSLAFELPADARAGTSTLRLGRSADDRLDSVVELELDLGALERVADLELEETRWAG